MSLAARRGAPGRRCSLALLALLAGPAAAHIHLTEPPARHEDQKRGPCGRADSVRGDRVSVFAPGQTITVRWTETVNHPGHYRIAFDADGDDDFYVPTAFDDIVAPGAEPSVLLDGIADRDGGEYAVQVTLPDLECERCTLQVVQMMTDKPPFDVSGYFERGNDLYYQCADLALRAGTPVPDGGLALDAGPAATSAGDAGGCAVGPGGAPTILGLLGLVSLAGLVGARRRRRG